MGLNIKNIRNLSITKGLLKDKKSSATDELLPLIRQALKELNVSYDDNCCGDSNLGYGGCPQCTQNYAQFYSLLDQQATVPNVAQAIVIEETAFASNISMQSDGTNLTRITFNNPGFYNIQFSAQLHNRPGGGNSGEIFIWFRINGNDIPDSNTRMTVTNNHYAVAAWNIFVEIENSGDYLQMVGFPTDTTIALEHIDATVDYPAVPSVILTVNQVG